MNQLTNQLGDLQEFPVERLAERALLRRVDTKFLTSAEALPEIIPALQGQYALLPAGGEAIATYRTMYFDSWDRKFYHQHRRGRRDRFKIRIRHYLDRSVSMLEIKRKSNHGVTSKKRRSHDFADHQLSQDDLTFLASNTPCRENEIVPQIWTDFRRITLVSLVTEERLTIDLGLEFTADNSRYQMPGLAIIEVKQPHFQPRTTAMLALREWGIRPSRMSKYCAGQAMLFPELRQNSFRPTLRKARRLNHV